MRALALLFIFGVFLLSGCANQASPAVNEARVGTWKTAQTIQPFLYQNHLPPNFNLEVLPFTNPGDQKAALLAGDLDMSGTTIALAITAASRGEPVVVVGGLCNKCSALVVRNDANIHTPAGLRGKRVAYVPGTMHHVLLLETLKRAGLDPEKDVEFKRIDFFDMGQALARGAVDAFCSGEPYPALAVAKGYGRILAYPYYDDSIGAINAGLLTTRDNIENNSELIQRLVTAHARSTEYLKANPEEWLDMAAGFGTDREVLDITAANIDLLWDLDKGYIRQAGNLAARMKDLGMISEIPDMETLFDLRFVEQAKMELEL